jgi:hypothetical protein
MKTASVCSVLFIAFYILLVTQLTPGTVARIIKKIPCQNGGIKNTKDGSCACPPCFTGLVCQTFASCCNTINCAGNRLPFVNTSTMQCQCRCQAEFTGANCSIPSVCSGYCRNGGAPTLSADAKTCTCACTPDYEGNRCESLSLCLRETC